MSVRKDTKNACTDMLQPGMSPNAAHSERRRLIKLEFPDTWPEV